MDRVKPDPNNSHNDVVMSGADADATPDPLCLEPTDPTVDAAQHRQRESESFSTNLDAPAPPPTRIQFSLRQLMLATLVIAVGLATLQLVLPIFVVFLLGVVAFAFSVGGFGVAARKTHPLCNDVVIPFPVHHDVSRPTNRVLPRFPQEISADCGVVHFPAVRNNSG